MTSTKSAAAFGRTSILVAALGFGSAAATTPESDLKSFRVVDAIELTFPIRGDAQELPHLRDKSHTHQSAGEQGAIAVLRRGNLATGMQEYSLVWFDTHDVLDFINTPERKNLPRQEALLRFETGGSEAGIQNLKWFPESRQLAFLGFRKETADKGQIYLFDLEGRRLRQLTEHSDSVSSYSLSTESQMLVYTANTTPTPGASKRYHYVVGAIADVRNNIFDFFNDPDARPVLTYFAMNLRSRKVVKIDANEPQNLPFAAKVFISPGGRWAVRQVRVGQLPESWRDYEAVRDLYDSEEGARVGWRSAEEAFGGTASHVMQYHVMDLERGTTRPLIDAPSALGNGYTSGDGGEGAVTWLKGGKRVVVAGAYLPLSGLGISERARRARTPVIAEVDVETAEVAKVGDMDVKDAEQGIENPTLEANAEDILLVKQVQHLESTRTREQRYRKRGTRWIRESSTWREGTPQAARLENFRLNLYAVDNLDTPPALAAKALQTGKQRVITDLNPHLREFELGHIEQVRWADRLGASWNGGLLLPTGYRSDRQYPLVIQTYGFSPRSTPYLLDRGQTAQPGRLFVGREIAVLQLGCESPPPEIAAKHEGLGALCMTVTCIEGAIDALDARGMIDRHRVGIVGFSQAGTTVHHAVTFSDYPLAAAVISDSVQTTPWNYLFSYGTPRPGMAEWDTPLPGARITIGAQFLGEGIKLWMERSPMFHLDKIRTPLLYENHFHLPAMAWDTYAILKRAQRPIEFVQYPQGVHDLARPGEQFASRQSILDWFAFWLKGEQRTAPEPDTPETADSLATQYERWRMLYAQQKAHLDDKLKAGADPKTLPTLPLLYTVP